MLENQDDRSVKQHLKAENRYTSRIMKITRPLQKRLFKEIVGRIQENDTTLPYKFREYWYYQRFEAGSNYEIYYRKKEAPDAPEELVFDVNKLARSYDYYTIEQFEISPNNQFAAYLVDTQGDGRTALNFRDLDTRASLEYQIPAVSMAAWGGDDLTVVYAVVDSTDRSFQVWQHQMGNLPENDTLLFEEKDPAFSVAVYKDKSEKYIFLESSSSTTSEIYYVHVDSLEYGFRLFRPREKKSSLLPGLL
ncbi:MAG: hypothetical protein HC880_09630 [Bacteroidia bacterium]|nr:hypothetical protein [Bacteroidia bacterium]